MVWEAAITPRLVYVRNRAAPNPSPLVQTKQPSWFMASRMSVAIAHKAYLSMFGLHSPAETRTRQPFHPGVDVLVLEPCCNGCRGFYCTRHQFTEEDRATVHSLAVQIDSPNLLSTALPCWVTISLSWPSVTTLYLLKNALKGDQREDKALVRITEGDRETDLRNRFTEWKKGPGKEKAIATLEFVVILDKEPDSVPIVDKYKTVEERKTGLPEDIIIG
ncbi:hypothetical protein BX600DRAFT_464025 [Xylariales sp. PMI_506]|nr:hypothetical protein BX600DRAFT_464025 [Xylariales sp. PMI_506]